MAFIVNKNLAFIDSMQFMNSSLDASIQNLTDNAFKYLSQEVNGAQLNLVKQKVVYPFQYTGSIEKFSEDKLADRCEFHSSIKDKRVHEKDRFIGEKGENNSEKDCLHAVNVWNEFKLKSLADYYDLYLKADVLLLADVFEKNN